MVTSKVKILLVDDDEIDRRAVIEAFRSKKIANEIIEAENGEEALEILRGSEGQSKLKQPYLILLDINMPTMDGHEFLRILRDDPKLSSSIVFVLTTSNSEEDLFKAYQQHIAGYIVKNQAADDLFKAIELIDHFMVSIEFPLQ
ncbi:MAG: response regulator [Oligoflexales bacterium]|nr:response regulator [Oligoflexales bacterium]